MTSITTMHMLCSNDRFQGPYHCSARSHVANRACFSDGGNEAIHKPGRGPYNVCSAGFTYMLDRLKPRASTFRGPPTNVYRIVNTVIGLSHLHVRCHNVLYFLNNPSAIFLTQLHPILEYCRI